MEYGAPTPDPTGGIGGYSSSVPHEKSESDFSDDSMTEGSIDEALSVPSGEYNTLMMPSDITGNLGHIPHSVMSSEEQDDNSQLDSGQESEEEEEEEEEEEDEDDEEEEEEESSNTGRQVGGEWLQSEEDGEIEGSDDEDEEEEEGEDGLIPKETDEGLNEQQLSKELERWQSPSNENENYDEAWGSESEEAANADHCSTDSDVESNEDSHSEKEEEQLQKSSSSAKSDKTLSPDSVLCFDEYGNLTTYRPEVPPPPPPLLPKLDFEKISNQEFLEAAETLESEMNESFIHKKCEQIDDNLNGTQNLEIKPLKSKPIKVPEIGEGSNVSDQELKLAFKEEFLTAATSRYGRARKRKTEDGFFFGTINFNELRKITSTTSPKKGKGITGNSNKSLSPEQKSKSLKDDSKPKTRLDEVMEEVINNGLISRPEVGVDRDLSSDVDSFKNAQELPVTKGDNDIVQNSLSDEMSPFGTDDYFSQVNNQDLRTRALKDEVKVSPKNEGKSHPKGKTLQKKEAKPVLDVMPKREKVSAFQEVELKTSLDDDVEKIKQAENQKRLSLPRRGELSLLRENEPPINFTSDRMLRRRSDVWKIKNALQAKTPSSLRKRSTRNSAQVEVESNATLPDVKSPKDTKTNSHLSGKKVDAPDVKSPRSTKANSHLSDTKSDSKKSSPLVGDVKSQKGVDHTVDALISPRAGRKLRSCSESTPISHKENNVSEESKAVAPLLSDSKDSSVTSANSKDSSVASANSKDSSVASANSKDSSVASANSQDSQASHLKTPLASKPSPKSKRERQSHHKSMGTPTFSSKEDESGSTTKFGRMVRKPQIMDVSVEAKKQKLEQKKNRTSLNSSIVGEVGPVDLDYNVLEKEHPCEHMVGDLVWVQLKGNPLWPAIISYQPETGEFTKLTVKQNWLGKCNCVRQYFVQFFNDNSQTYWITPINALPFEGYSKLKEYLYELKTKVKLMKSYQRNHAEGLLKTLAHVKKITSKDESVGEKGVSTGEKGNNSIRQKGERWMVAIEEGERAKAMDRYERLQKYALDIREEKDDDKGSENIVAKKSPQRKSNVGRKRKQGRPGKSSLKEKVLLGITNSSDDTMSTDGEFSGFDETYSSDENRNVSSLISDISAKENFGQYAAKHLQKFILENPNISEAAARTKLRWRWKKLAKSQAARRKSKLLTAMKNENKARNNEAGSLKRKHRNSVERCDDLEDGDATASKRKRVEESKDSGKGVYKVVRNEKVCYLCESSSTENGADMIRCKGVCYGMFHLSCVGLSTIPKQDFKCVECQTGEHQCFLCKSVTGARQRCTVPFCGKFYHEECIHEWPQVSKNRHQEKFICPRHVCHMCAANADDMNDPMARNPTFTRCLRCPTTYHTGEECIAAGSEEISQNHHICTKHLKLTKNSLHHVNVSWCFCCSKGGSLLLCDQCPAAFHADCMKITTPEGSYVCEDCENGKFPVYGDVVWVKLGLYRWWPGQVLHPRYIPDNIENLPHQQGMFCVHFFGSNDYYWVTRGRAFHYQEGDKGSKAASSKTLEMQFQRAIQEALEAYRIHRTRKTQLEAVRSGKGNLKPPPYVRIDTNRPVGNVRLNKIDLGSVNRCDCDPFSPSPCGSDDKCLNRMLMFECVREVCGGGDKCGNQRFQKRLFANVSSFRTEARGWGLKSNEDIKKGDFVIEYVGELIDDEEFHKRIEEMHKVKEENYYFLTIDKDIMIDAGPKGNLARFMNHSCEPNCETQKWTVGGDTRVGLFASCDIPAGSELTFNYNLQCVGTEKKICNCGAANCSGFIGAKVQKNDSNGQKREKLGKRKRKRKRREIKISEDECYRCGGAGDLILCDVTDCPKSYHLQCLSLDKLPKGKWICPWHHCDECGQRSIRPNRCDYCPNSFCRQHVPGNLQNVPGVGNVCQDHDTEDIETLRGQMEAIAATEVNMVYDDHDSMGVVENCAIDGDQNSSHLPNNASCDIVPSYTNDTNVNTSSNCIYEKTLSPFTSNSSQEHDQADMSLIVPLRMRQNRCRPKKSDRVSEGHENNSSVINVNSDICLSQTNSKNCVAAKSTVVTPKNGIRSRSVPENVAKAVNFT